MFAESIGWNECLALSVASCQSVIATRMCSSVIEYPTTTSTTSTTSTTTTTTTLNVHFIANRATSPRLFYPRGGTGNVSGRNNKFLVESKTKVEISTRFVISA